MGAVGDWHEGYIHVIHHALTVLCNKVCILYKCVRMHGAHLGLFCCAFGPRALFSIYVYGARTTALLQRSSSRQLFVYLYLWKPRGQRHFVLHTDTHQRGVLYIYLRDEIERWKLFFMMLMIMIGFSSLKDYTCDRVNLKKNSEKFKDLRFHERDIKYVFIYKNEWEDSQC